jgi:hypothetical protein
VNAYVRHVGTNGRLQQQQQKQQMLLKFVFSLMHAAYSGVVELFAEHMVKYEYRCFFFVRMLLSFFFLFLFENFKFINSKTFSTKNLAVDSVKTRGALI